MYSLDSAIYHREPWNDEDTQVLMDLWGAVPITELAQMLGRTTEALRRRRSLVLRGVDARGRPTKYAREFSDLEEKDMW